MLQNINNYKCVTLSILAFGILYCSCSRVPPIRYQFIFTNSSNQDITIHTINQLRDTFIKTTYNLPKTETFSQEYDGIADNTDGIITFVDTAIVIYNGNKYVLFTKNSPPRTKNVVEAEEEVANAENEGDEENGEEDIENTNNEEEEVEIIEEVETIKNLLNIQDYTNSEGNKVFVSEYTFTNEAFEQAIECDENCRE